jgi:hypothetical protein
VTGGGWKTEDLQPRLVGGPEDYAYNTEGPVRYLAVASDSGTLGYLWASDEDNAAGFEPRPGAGGDAFNAAVSWRGKLREAKNRGRTPTQALVDLAADPGTATMGRAVPGSEAEASSLRALRELAGKPEPDRRSTQDDDG